ncbi:hypothetical protein BU26DRAFT_498882 [Trematosphaeria pertusa]|uniref:Uncharacterized protein n=1 Tax=Trematosphaeria pertusa TaxID=390896 RepID=A0A6A6J2N5_9PLEO|nr:uncharacterized protein BU26DRAFT_498882 [Trematosphaeria pertusa]KAF2256170.1 hypothetical protein BU26DRAFT_498882 [Trematosphaeria pertusa]
MSSTSPQPNDGFIPFKTKASKKPHRRLEKAQADRAIPALKTGSIPNLKTLDPDSIKQLLSGPRVTVYCDGKIARSAAPKRALIAAIPRANAFFTVNPLAPAIHFAGVDRETGSEILRALERDLGRGEHSVALPFAKSFTHGVLLYQAALALGLTASADPVRRYLYATVSKRLLEYTELDTALLRIGPEDGVFGHIANVLAHRRYKKMIPDPEDFAVYLDGWSVLKERMAGIDRVNSAVRKERRKEFFRRQGKGEKAGEKKAQKTVVVGRRC